MNDWEKRYAEWSAYGRALAAEATFRRDTSALRLDARLSLLDPEMAWNDCFVLMAAHVSRHVPIGGYMLDLCCGDGFWDWSTYVKRASLIDAVDRDMDAIAVAVEHHSHAAIRYTCCSIEDYQPKRAYYGVVACRGALMQMSWAARKRCVTVAHDALVPGGVFVGDAPMKDEAHSVAAFMRDQFKGGYVQVSTLPTAGGRINHLWVARKGE